MNIEWNEAKRRSNLHKHGFDFADAGLVFAGEIVTAEDTRWEYGETRFVTLGLLRGRAVVIIHTEDEESIRVISMRKATRNEERIYYQTIGN